MLDELGIQGSRGARIQGGMRTTIDTYKARAGRLDLDGIDSPFADRPLTPGRCARFATCTTWSTTPSATSATCCSPRPTGTPRSPPSCPAGSTRNCGTARPWPACSGPTGDGGRPRVAALRRRRHRRGRADRPPRCLGPGRPRLHRRPHGLGGGQRVDHPGRLRPAGRLGEHPAFRELLGRIMRQEGATSTSTPPRRHRRLAESPKAAALTRYALARLWRPVGPASCRKARWPSWSTTSSPAPTARPWPQRIDRRMDALPGQDGLHLVSGAIDRWRRPEGTAVRHSGRTARSPAQRMPSAAGPR